MAVVYIILAALLWGTLGPASLFAYKYGMSPLEVAFWRGAISGCAYFVHALVIGRMRLARRDWLGILAFAVFAVALLNGSYQLSVNAGGAGFAAILLYSAPVWVALFSFFLFKESMPPAKLLALLVVMVGVVGVALAGSGDIKFSVAAVFWGVLSGISYALYYLFGKVYFPRYAAATIFMVAFPLSSLALVPFVEFTSPTPAAWGVLFFIGLVSTYLAYLFYSFGLKKLEATHVAIIATVEPVFSNLLAFWVWEERFSPWGYLFGSCVLLGVVLVTVAGRNRGSYFHRLGNENHA